MRCDGGTACVITLVGGHAVVLLVVGSVLLAYLFLTWD